METQQNATTPPKKTDESLIPVPYSELNYIQRAYIDWKSLNGLITDDDGIRKMSLSQLATELQVERSTIYRAMEKVPNQWELIEEKRKELSGRARLARVNETWYLKAVKGDFQHMQLWLANFDKNFRMPTQKVEHEAGGGLADLLNQARERRRVDASEIQEGEVVDVETPADA